MDALAPPFLQWCEEYGTSAQNSVVTDRKFDNYRKCYTQLREFVKINNIFMDVKEVISSGDN